MSINAIVQGYRETRIKSPAKTREPALLVIGRAIGRAANIASRLSSVFYQLPAFGCIVAAGWMVSAPLGLLATGISLLVLDALRE